MNLVSRKMVIKEFKDRFLVRRKYGSGQFGEDVFAVESGLCGSIRRASVASGIYSAHMQKGPVFRLGLSLNLMPGSSLLSHGETPHYHRRYGVSLLSSAWGQVGPPRYGRQANSVLSTRPVMTCRFNLLSSLLIDVSSAKTSSAL